jgi:histidyl-tRNA synthetase
MLDRKYMIHYIKWMNEFRKMGINAEIFIQDEPLGKQLKYANNKGIKYVVIAGEDEFNNDTIKLKDMLMGRELSFVNTKSLPGIPKILNEIKSSPAD